MLIVWIFNTLASMAAQIVELMPMHDFSYFSDLVASINTFFCFVAQSNSFFPVFEMIGFFGVYLGTVAALGGVTTIRKIWSLVTGGGGA